MKLMSPFTVIESDESRGVSPVIATILVVAIVVIISASLAAVTFGFTDDLGDPAPVASFEYKYNSGWNITHTHGESIDSSKIKVRIDDPDEKATGVYEWPNSGTVSAGTTVNLGNSDTTGNEEVSIIWDDGDRSYSISSSSNPGSSSGNGGGGGPTLAVSFGEDTQSPGNNNPINIELTNEDGNPISSETVSVEITGDSAVSASSSGLVIPPDNFGKDETFTTDSNGEVPNLVFSSDVNLNPGDIVQVQVDAPNQGLSKTITYEIV